MSDRTARERVNAMMYGDESVLSDGLLDVLVKVEREWQADKDEIARLKAELNGKKLSLEVTTMCACEDCGAATRWGRHLDMDCKTIAEQRDEIARLRKAIEDAPHPIWCYANPEVNHRNLGPCDCWKSKALGEQK